MIAIAPGDEQLGDLVLWRRIFLHVFRPERDMKRLTIVGSLSREEAVKCVAISIPVIREQVILDEFLADFLHKRTRQENEIASYES